MHPSDNFYSLKLYGGLVKLVAIHTQRSSKRYKGHSYTKAQAIQRFMQSVK